MSYKTFDFKQFEVAFLKSCLYEYALWIFFIAPVQTAIKKKHVSVKRAFSFSHLLNETSLLFCKQMKDNKLCEVLFQWQQKW